MGDSFIPADLEPVQYPCHHCGLTTEHPHWGCHAPDVGEVVQRLRDCRNMLQKDHDGPTVVSYELHKLADKLEGKS
jgi:hypothetical protein